ncbi:MAG: preprotein translocase subunit YajC [Ilumatobacteraceae bacterium]
MIDIAVLAQESSESSPFSFVILLLLPVLMYFILIRPQRKRMKQQAAMQSQLAVGDEVLTNSGIYGFISSVEDDLFWLEIDDDVQIRVAKGAVQGKVPSKATDADDSADAADAGQS